MTKTTIHSDNTETVRIFLLPFGLNFCASQMQSTTTVYYMLVASILCGTRLVVIFEIVKFLHVVDYGHSGRLVWCIPYCIYLFLALLALFVMALFVMQHLQNMRYGDRNAVIHYTLLCIYVCFYRSRESSSPFASGARPPPRRRPDPAAVLHEVS
jgi:hypothetical protein